MSNANHAPTGYKGFKCPRCGGYKWGTNNISSDYSKWTGHCQGGDGFEGCGFTWDRARDDINLLGEPLIDGYVPPSPSIFSRLRTWARLVFLGKRD
jgi:hypothetical protein